MTSAAHVEARSLAVAAGVRVVGAALLAATGAIHLHLYDSGYRTIATIGPLFLLNGVLGIAVAAALVVVPRRWLPWVSLAGGALEAGTLGGLLLSLTVGLFGFTESAGAPLVGTTIAVESAGAVLLVGFAAPTVLRALARLRGSAWRGRGGRG